MNGENFTDFFNTIQQIRISLQSTISDLEKEQTKILSAD